MTALPTRARKRALTGSAFKIDRSRNADYAKRLTQPWQTRALYYYDEIGEFRQAAQFYARMMSKVIFYAGRYDPKTGTITRIDDGLPAELLARVRDPGGGRTQLQYDYGKLMWITGEGVLFASELDTPDERWRFLWKEEVRVDERTGEAVRLDAQGRPTDERGVAYRFWTPHPRRSDEADSPMRAIGMIAEELLRLTATVMSTATSRMLRGMMIIPMESLAPSFQVDGDEDPEQNPTLRDYIEHVSKAIENPHMAEAQVPYLFTPPYDYADSDHLRWMPTHDPSTDYLEQRLREECLTRAAIAFDMPPEAFKGLGDTNHWASRSIQLDTWISHGKDKALRFANDLASAYLRPALRERGYEGWSEIVIGMDDSQVVVSPDRSQQALDALQWGVIGYPAARSVLGYTEDQAPTEEELERILVLRSRNPALADGVAGERGPMPEETTERNPSDGPPLPTKGRAGSRQEALRASIEVGAAAMALRRCRELAGARLRSEIVHACKACHEKVAGSSNALVASVLGAEQVKELGQEPLKLVQGGANGFREQLLEWGYASEEATAISRAIEVYAAKTLYETSPRLPPGLIAQIERAKEVTDAYAA